MLEVTLQDLGNPVPRFFVYEALKDDLECRRGDPATVLTELNPNRKSGRILQEILRLWGED